MTGAIHILNASALPNSSFDGIVIAVRHIFKQPTTFTQIKLNTATAYDQSRQQYNSTALLAQILNTRGQASDKRISVVDIDLYIPVLTFVFGEAQFGGNAAIVSTHRLTNQFYGLPRNDEILVQRLEKEIIHELGHTFGLYHCRQFECVMRSSTYVEEIDLKHATPCTACEIIIKQH